MVRLELSRCPLAPTNVPVQRRRGSAVRCNRLLGVIVPLAPEYNMGGFLRRNELNAFVSQSAHVNPLEQSLSPAQQDRRDSDVQLIDEARTKILLDSVRSAANAHIHSVGCVARPVKRLVNTARDEVERRSAFHLDGRARVMRVFSNSGMSLKQPGIGNAKRVDP